MELITKVNTWTKDGKTKVIFNDKHFITEGYVNSLTNLKCNYNLLIGSSIEVNYYEIGEEIAEEKLCTKANTIVKSCNIELSDRLMQFSLAAAFGTVVSIN